MSNKKLPDGFSLPDYLSSEQKERIERAVVNNTPIIITGVQGRTGKTFLKDYLEKFGIAAYELWECEVVELNEPIEDK
jgi:hypothetical protein